MSEWKDIHKPCPCGKSSDAYCINDKGWGHCFSCNKNFNEGGKEFEEPEGFESFSYHATRGISRSTFERYKVQTKFLDGLPTEQGFKYPQGTIQLRNLVLSKSHRGHFRTIASDKGMKYEGCFGTNLFEAGGKRCVITEGCYDAMAAYEMLGGHVPCFAVMSSSSAVRQVENDFDKLNSYDKVYIIFDSDEQGQKAAKEVASLFDFSKVYNVKLEEFKDANDFLVNQKASSFADAVSSAKKYSPDNITNTFSGMRKALESGHEERIGTYPFEKLNEMLFGLYREEVVLIIAETGIGKTEIFRAMQYHLLKTEPTSRLAITHLEEGNDTTIRGLATYQANYPYIHKKDTSDISEIMDAVEELVQDESRVHLYQSYDFEDDKTLLETIRYLVKVCGVNFVFLDHISWLATGGELSEDERRKLDKISQKIKMLSKELHICFVMVSHVNDDGRTRGSRNIEKVANTIIEIKRDKEAADEDEKNRLYFTVKKGRGHGTQTGYAGYANYNRKTLVLEDQPKSLEV